MLPRHARLQNMTYSAKIKVNVTVEVYTQNLVRSEKFKLVKNNVLTSRL
ncbi:putative DNA-directed RNA polymerase [Rosa chinensis]|uniref:Putative DNA-directed RNA polymerase n=1 Tax=Rosa chinensis TaxID=74649 RepID=A0A2P6QD09_ROSCH|nr:putative DNA-directed RNA polymerase [Rosa chinensis]